METSILEVMESWPLELALQTPSGREVRALTEDARIWRGVESVAAVELRSGQRVRLLKTTESGDIAEITIVD
jgi:hypothetical protein